MNIGIAVAVGIGGALLLVILGLIGKVLVIEKAPLNKDSRFDFDSDAFEEDLEDYLIPRRNLDFPDDIPDGVDLDKMSLVDYYSDILGETEKGGAHQEPMPLAHEREEALVENDSLTGLRCGEAFHRECQAILDAAKKEKTSWAVVYFDFDRFKLINSLKGVNIGDFALQHIVQRLPEVFGEHAIFSRITADHFFALLPYHDVQQFEIIADNMKQACRAVMEGIGVKTGLNVSMGMAVTQNTSWSYRLPVLMERANIAHYTIKANRKVSYIVYSSSIVFSHFYGESALENFKENQFDDEYVLHWRPSRRLDTRRVCGVQVRAGWRIMENTPRQYTVHDAIGALPGYCAKMLYKVCKEINSCRKQDISVLPVTLPLSMIDLYKEDIDALVNQCLTDFQVKPQLLEFLVDSEKLPVEMETSFTQLRKLRDLGVRLALGNVDPRSRALEMLPPFPFDRIQVRPGFLRDLKEKAGDEGQQNLSLGWLVNFARTFNTQILVEDIQIEEQARVAAEKSCKFGQGPYFDPPMSTKQYTSFLQELAKERANTRGAAPEDLQEQLFDQAQEDFVETSSADYEQLPSADILPFSGQPPKSDWEAEMQAAYAQEMEQAAQERKQNS
ncbi:diguanylate cyclase [Oscillospiraceae bacterium MB08-C2-2]|nr:diguanylate cyclase [Oscillospiraceae bacterium MB08-C2-2]